MSTNTSPLIEILDSLAKDWEYAPLIRKKLESGDISSEQITELTAILWSGILKIDNEKTRLEIEDALFRKLLIKTEESSTRKSENKDAETLLANL